MNNPPLGLVHEATLHIDETLVVPNLPKALAAMADMPPVFATAYMIAFIEAACIEALAPYLEEGEATVGTHVDVSHSAATPVGLSVTAEVTLLACERRKFRFQLRCHDGVETIGQGFHERALISRSRFAERLEAKRLRADERG